MLYLLAIILLFTVSFGQNNDCNSIIFIHPGTGTKVASPTNQCQISSGTSYQYLCNGTEINFIAYNSSDCSGNPSQIQPNICKLAPDGCIAICDKNDCNGISTTTYSTNDCSGDIQLKYNYLPGICVGSSTGAQKLTCIDNGQIQYNTYSSLSTNCSGNPSNSSSSYNSTICNGQTDGSSVKYDGCDSSSSSTKYPSNSPSKSPSRAPSKSPSNSPSNLPSTSASKPSSDSSCTIFTLFGAIITIFILSLF